MTDLEKLVELIYPKATRYRWLKEGQELEITNDTTIKTLIRKDETLSVVRIPIPRGYMIVRPQPEAKRPFRVEVRGRPLTKEEIDASLNEFWKKYGTRVFGGVDLLEYQRKLRKEWQPKIY